MVRSYPAAREPVKDPRTGYVQPTVIGVAGRRGKGARAMGKIVTLGEVVADVYREDAPSDVELPFTARPGGAPANVAVAAARLGAEAGFIGRLGDDLFGDFILEALESVGVDTSAVLRQAAHAHDARVRRGRRRRRPDLHLLPLGSGGRRAARPGRHQARVARGRVVRELRQHPADQGAGALGDHRLAELANEMDVGVAFDVNLRENLWDSLDTFRTPCSRCSTSRPSSSSPRTSSGRSWAPRTPTRPPICSTPAASHSSL